jgi:hypothetical protein
MKEDHKYHGWWQTIPGMLTATAGIITAMAGLIVALNQAGLLSPAANSEAGAEIITREQLTANRPSAARSGASRATASLVGQSTRHPRAPAAGTEVRLAHAVYRILEARVEPRNMEQLTLRLTVRMTNTGRYPDNFWDSTFRLLVDGVPRAPVSNLNKLVLDNSAEEGEVEFVVPAVTQTTMLRLSHANESTEIPVDLSSEP